MNATTEQTNRLREIRESKKLTQEQLAAISEVHAVNICKIERGKRKLCGNTLIRLARALKTDPFYLLGETP